jgi:hypothetical protein
VSISFVTALSSERGKIMKSMKLTAILMSVFIAVGVVSAQSGTPEVLPNLAATAVATETPSAADLLYEALRDGDCSHPCFMGIEVGKSTRDEVDAIFELYDVEFYERETDTPENAAYEFVIPPQFVPFLAEEDLPTGGSLTFGNNIVIAMYFLVHLETETVLEAFGPPDAVRNFDNLLFKLVYFDERLMFNVLPEEKKPIKIIYLMSTIQPNPLDVAYAPNVDTPCESYGTPPCIAPTAVPVTTTKTAAATLNKTPIATAVP